METIVVDYEAGNLRSVETALRRLGVPYRVTGDADAIAAAPRIIFPGVGDGSHAMRVLTGRRIGPAIRAAFTASVPILGICLGSQVVLDRTEEGDTAGLGLVAGSARRFRTQPGLKVPHMGWNEVEWREGHWLFDGLPQRTSFYFVHSYYPDPADPHAAVAWSDYGGRFAVAIEAGSLVAVQFHPEKSGEAGLTLLRNYLSRTEG